MCGITGFVGRGDQGDLTAMMAALAHRGPDDEGRAVDEPNRVFLGHRRLVVIDPSGGRQPMENEDGSVVVVFNGAIYNHVELRRELEGRGHRFRSDHSDTEVLVHGYEEWGEALPGRLNGMFAFVVYDRACRRVFAARDRFGEKPFYWVAAKGLFAFASELSALFRHSGLTATLDPVALQKLFAYGYIPAPRALYHGSHKLAAGHSLVFDLTADTVSLRCYWRFRLEPDSALGDDKAPELAEELRSLMATAVERRMVADVPVGIFLSGGIDSSAVLAMAARAAPGRPIRTFTIGFRDPSYDESAWGREVAGHFGSIHTECMLDFEAAVAMTPTVLRGMDEPLGDPSLLPTHLLCREARREVTVALGGDGADELFAGYDPFKALGIARWCDRLLSRGATVALRHAVDLLPRSDRNMSRDFKLRRGVMGLGYPAAMRNPVWMSPLEPGLIREMFEAPVSPAELYEEAIELWESAPHLDDVDRTLEFFTVLYLQNDILTKVDRAAMANSLEVRAPFLDNDLVAFCCRLPNRFKFRNGRGKVLMRRALEGVLPRPVLDRPKKGFGIPVSSWLRRIPFPASPVGLSGIDAAAVSSRWLDHAEGRADWRLMAWTWLALAESVGGVPRPAEIGGVP